MVGEEAEIENIVSDEILLVIEIVDVGKDLLTRDEMVGGGTVESGSPQGILEQGKTR